jgi:glycosyltransferase involved in cell wall biosynthesis
MKVLYIINESNLNNGWAVINYHTIKNAVYSGHEVDVICASDSENLPIEGVEYKCFLPLPGKIRSSLKDFFFSVMKLRKNISEGDYDFVHVLIEPYMIYFAFMSHPRLIMSLVGTYSIQPFVRSGVISYLYRKSLYRVYKFLSISQFTADLFRKKVFSNDATFVVPLGVDFERFFKDVNRDDTSKKEESFCLVGMIKERKGVLFAIQAIELLIPKFPRVKLYLVGDDQTSFAIECKNYVEKNNLSGKVKFVGRIDDKGLEDIYTKCLANVLPSVNTSDGCFEGFGLVHLEANASGIPSIGSSNCGNESAIIEGVNGYLAEQRNVHSISEKMKLVLEKFEQNDYNKLVESSIEHARKNDWKSYFTRLEKFYC